MALKQGYSASGLHTPAALDSPTMQVTMTTSTAMMLKAPATRFDPCAMADAQYSTLATLTAGH
jgi:hypothetical protein